jgi:hypothetical protein
MVQEQLSDDEVYRHLAIPRSEGALIGDLYDLARGLVSTQDTLRGRLDQKAASQATASGISLTVVVAFLAAGAMRAPSSDSWWMVASVLIALASLGVGVASAGFAAVAMSIDSYRIVDARSALQCASASAGSGSAKEDWRLAMTGSLVRMAQENEAALASRARWLKHAQVLYLMFLAAVCVAVAFGVAGMLVSEPK